MVGQELQKNGEAKGPREGKLGPGQHQRKAKERKEKLCPVLTQAQQNPTSVRAMLGGILGRKNILLIRGPFILHLRSRLEVAPISGVAP